ncbi:hypothetical protein [Bradyrhizobium sp.]|uniref:hypothetical protein n=1 Tax=Bradyrhizobium sp. TaxID=376 RepID=UPI002732E914|nr:hypothetical protein [Bradyrhizobium sp.]MDP3693183.1 hypothetical protein [Bradyrhizobium sp.]
MKKSSILMGAVVWALMAVTPASAQFVLPGGSQFNPPPPAPPPPPKIEVPAIPQMDAPLPVPQVQGLQRGSFGDRIGKCLQDGAAAGLGPNERAAYSRACANQ